MLKTHPLLKLIAIGLLSVPSSLCADELKPPQKAGLTMLDVRLIDNSVVKLAIVDAKVEFHTSYGKLEIPVSEIRRVDLALRIPDELQIQISHAIADLANSEFRKREAATVFLLQNGEKSVPAVRIAMRSPDAEVAKRAEDVLEKLEAVLPPGRMDVSDQDVVHTLNSKIAGKIVSPVLKAKSFAFGDIQLRLADAIALSANGFKDETEKITALPDPGSLTAYQGPQHVGKTYAFQVTGAVAGSLWGTETYTLDSTLAAAAVHVGLLKPGQSGVVKVEIFGPSANFVGSTQNGLTSSPYQNYPGAYKILTKPRR